MYRENTKYNVNIILHISLQLFGVFTCSGKLNSFIYTIGLKSIPIHIHEPRLITSLLEINILFNNVYTNKLT
jgi:hypothetical protein